MSNNEMNISNNENVVMNDGNNIEEKKEELQLLGLEPQSAAGLAVGAVAPIQNAAAGPLVAPPLVAPPLVAAPLVRSNSAGGRSRALFKFRAQVAAARRTHCRVAVTPTPPER